MEGKENLNVGSPLGGVSEAHSPKLADGVSPLSALRTRNVFAMSPFASPLTKSAVAQDAVATNMAANVKTPLSSMQQYSQEEEEETPVAAEEEEEGAWEEINEAAEAVEQVAATAHQDEVAVMTKTDETMETLRLERFQPKATLDFGGVRPGTRALRSLRIINPGKKARVVSIQNKVPFAAFTLAAAESCLAIETPTTTTEHTMSNNDTDIITGTVVSIACPDEHDSSLIGAGAGAGAAPVNETSATAASPRLTSFEVPARASRVLHVTWHPAKLTNTGTNSNSKNKKNKNAAAASVTGLRQLISLYDGHHPCFQVVLTGSLQMPRHTYRAKAVPRACRKGGKPTLFHVGARKPPASSTVRLSLSPAPSDKNDDNNNGSPRRCHRFLRANSKRLIQRVNGKGPNPALMRLRAKAKKAEEAKAAKAAKEAREASAARPDADWLDRQSRGFMHWMNHVLCPPLEEDSMAGRTRAIECQHKAKIIFVKIVHPALAKFNTALEKGEICLREDRFPHADMGMRDCLVGVLMGLSPQWLRLALNVTLLQDEAADACTDKELHTLLLPQTTDDKTLARCLTRRLLNSPKLDKEYAHPKVPAAHTEGYDEAVRRHTVRAWMALVAFSDAAKRAELLPGSPALFRADSGIKSTRELLNTLSRELLAAEGDFASRCKKEFGLVCDVTQSPLDEVEWRVSDIGTDLRDGVRLARLASVLIAKSKAKEETPGTEEAEEEKEGEKMVGVTVTDASASLMSKLRLPAGSILQKRHNAKCALDALNAAGCSVAPTTQHDIVAGTRNKTVALLWRMAMHFEVRSLIDVQRLEREVKLLRRSISYRAHCSTHERRVSGGDMYLNAPELSALLAWARTVCAAHGVEVSDFAGSFSDGRALCFLVHHYHPDLLPASRVAMETTQTVSSARGTAADAAVSVLANKEAAYSATFSPGLREVGGRTHQELLRAERSNYKVLHSALQQLGGIPLLALMSDMSGTVPDEKVVIATTSYLCARLMEVGSETLAALKIQRAWRRMRDARVMAEHLPALAQKGREVEAQRTQMRMKAAVELRERTRAVVTLQAGVRGYLARQQVQVLRQEKRQREQMLRAVVTLQSAFRAKLARQVVARRRQVQFQQQTHAATVIQACVRGYFVRMQAAKTKAAAEEDARMAAEQEAEAARQEEERLRLEQDAKLAAKAEAEAAEEARLKAEMRARLEGEEARLRAEQEARFKAEAEAAAVEARAQAEAAAAAEAKRLQVAEAARIQAEIQAAAVAEADAAALAKAKAEIAAAEAAATEAKARAEAEAKAAEAAATEAKARAEAEAKAAEAAATEAKARAEAEAKAAEAAAAEAKARAEAEAKAAEAAAAEAKARAEAEAKAAEAAAAEAKARAEEEAKAAAAKAEAKEEEMRVHFEEEQARLNAELADRQAAAAAEEARLKAAADAEEEARCAEEARLENERATAATAAAERMVAIESVSRRHAATVIQSAVRAWLEARALVPVRAATCIQSYWRSYCVRRAASAPVHRAYARVLRAAARAEPHLTLGQRAHSALEVLLTHKKLTFVLQAVKELDAVTRLSASCCEQMVADRSAVAIVFQLVRSCNRSTPHMAVLRHGLNILVHLARCKSTRQVVFGERDSLATAVELLQMYRDQADIFQTACKLLSAMCQDDKMLSALKADAALSNRIRGIQRLLLRKSRLESRMSKPGMAPRSVRKAPRRKGQAPPAEPVAVVSALVAQLDG
eukprot:UC1_evm2s2027